jgi:hypothetical protein
MRVYRKGRCFFRRFRRVERWTFSDVAKSLRSFETSVTVYQQIVFNRLLYKPYIDGVLARVGILSFFFSQLAIRWF